MREDIYSTSLCDDFFVIFLPPFTFLPIQVCGGTHAAAASMFSPALALTNFLLVSKISSKKFQAHNVVKQLLRQQTSITAKQSKG